VCHTLYLMLTLGRCSHCLRSIDMFSGLLAALGHDCDHPGNSNSFEVANSSEKAMAHNDDAVLERHHSRTLFEVMKREENNVMASFEAIEQQYMRRLMIHAILGTDMSKVSIY